jgi:hypothetical protein
MTRQKSAEPAELTDQSELARRVAHILGPASGAARAVERYDALRAAGHQTAIHNVQPYWLVKEPVDAE